MLAHAMLLLQLCWGFMLTLQQPGVVLAPMLSWEAPAVPKAYASQDSMAATTRSAMLCREAFASDTAAVPDTNKCRSKSCFSLVLCRLQ